MLALNLFIIVLFAVALRLVSKFITDKTFKGVAFTLLIVVMIFWPGRTLYYHFFGGTLNKIEYALYQLEAPFNKDGSSRMVGDYNEVTGEVTNAPKGTKVNPFTGAPMKEYKSEWAEILYNAKESAKRGTNYRVKKNIKDSKTETFYSAPDQKMSFYFLGNKNDSVRITYYEKGSSRKRVEKILKSRKFLWFISGSTVVYVENLSSSPIDMDCYYPIPN